MVHAMNSKPITWQDCLTLIDRCMEELRNPPIRMGPEEAKCRQQYMAVLMYRRQEVIAAMRREGDAHASHKGI